MFVLQRFVSKHSKKRQTKTKCNNGYSMLPVNATETSTGSRIEFKHKYTQDALRQISLKNGSKSYYTKKYAFCDETVCFMVKIIFFIAVDIFFWSQVNNMFETWFNTTPKNPTTSALIFLMTFLSSIIFNAFLAVIIYTAPRCEFDNEKELK